MRRSTSKAAMAGAMAILIVLQRWAGSHSSGDAREVVGYAASIAFLALVAGLGMTRARSDGRDGGRVGFRRLCVILAVLLACNALGAELAPVLSIRRVAPPNAALVASALFWVGAIAWIRLRCRSTGSLAVALAALAVSTRLLVIAAWPFGKLDGDMLATIERALGELAAGRFPYRDYPPPMPYMPATFLAYAPAFALGLDLRLINLVLDAAAVACVVLFGSMRERYGREGASEASGPRVEQVLLPCFMLHPLWVNYAANSQLSPSLLAATLLGLAVVRGGCTAQAAALGLAAGSNQTLGACAPILLAHWAGRLGVRRSLRLASLSAGISLLVILPFLLWRPGAFLETAFLSRPLPGLVPLAGQYSLLPLVSGWLPKPSLVGTVLAVGAASWFAYRTREPSVVATAMAMGLAGALMFQPVSFSHYFLPVIPLVLVTPGEATPQDDAGT